MSTDKFAAYVCPATRLPLRVETRLGRSGESAAHVLRSEAGHVYPVTDGIPDLTFPATLDVRDSHARDFYEGRAEDYDKYLHLTFKTHGEDEQVVRNRMIDLLELKPTYRVLEIACGTGRDSELIARRLGPEGRLFVQDIAPAMVQRCRERLAGATVPVDFSVANACHLPFPAGSFDAVYSFGGLGEFSDRKRSFAEMVRVCRLGAKIVVGDEGMPPWLRTTEFARILATTNKQFLADIPLADIPVEARDLTLRWVIGGVFYLIDFRVGSGEPAGDFDFEIPGPRGGTLRTRYEGQLEGVTPEAKQLAHVAREKRGVSMHRWLDSVVREAAERDLKADRPGDRSEPGRGDSPPTLGCRVEALRWRKMGLVFRPTQGAPWMKTHAQVPTPLVGEGFIRVYFASRPEQQLSLTSFVDLDAGDPTKVLRVHETPILELGRPGTFDEHGIMPSCAVRVGSEVYLYYSGWQRGTSVPYTNSTGIAVSTDGGVTFRRVTEGPVLGRSVHDPYSATSPCVLAEGTGWRMWYCAGTGWLKVGEKYEHTYDIKYARSNDGIRWHTTGEVAVAQADEGEALTRPWILRSSEGYAMWFCRRGSHDFRDGSEAYTLGFASSPDAARWQRDDGRAGLTPSTSDWDSRMLAYPAVLAVDGQLLMFYNGNEFGREGFGVATTEKANYSC